jgi:hypothetical protein
MSSKLSELPDAGPILSTDLLYAVQGGVMGKMQAGALIGAAAAAGGAKIYASQADALSNGVVSATITAGGSGGTTGAYTVPTTGGGGTQGLARVTVSGGAITAVNSILNKGRGYTSAPTFDLSGITGLTGATLTGVIGQNEPVGRYWGVASATPSLYDFYVTATVSTATLLGSAPDLASITELRNAGTDRNLWPDPFFTDTSISATLTTGDGLRGIVADSPYTFYNVTPAGTIAIQAAPAAWGYPGANILRRQSVNAAPAMVVNLDRFGAAINAGDNIQFAFEGGLLAAGGPFTSGTMVSGTWRDRSGVVIGSTVTLIVLTAGVPLSATVRQYVTAQLTVPAGAVRMDISLPWLAAVSQDYGFTGFQMVVNGTVRSKAIQRPPLADGSNRIKALEDSSPGAPANGVLLRRTTYASAVSNFPQGTGTPLGAALASFSGYGSSMLAAACPAVGFNGIADAWTWQPSPTLGPARIYVAVRTSVSGINPIVGGKTLAVGFIDVEPNSGSAGGAAIQLFDPFTKLPKTVMPADLLDVLGLAYFGVTTAGGPATGMWISRILSLSNIDPTFPGYYIANGSGLSSGFPSVASSTQSWYPSLLLMTSPVTKVATPAGPLITAVASRVEEVPSLAGLPQKLWGIVGHTMDINYAPLMLRDARRTIVNPTLSIGIPGTYPTNPSATLNECFRFQPAAAGNCSLLLTAALQDTPYDSRTVNITTIAASGGSGTSRFLMLGDSMTAGAGMQLALNTLAAADGVTGIVNVGTMGTNPTKNEGYSGQGLGIFFTAGNPFYNPSTLTFDFAYYVANSLAGVPPTHVLIAGGFWHVASSNNDSAALSAAISCCNTMATMIASIHAYDPTMKVGVWSQPSSPREPQDGEPRPVTGIAPAQRHRSLKILAAQVIATFSGLEASKTFVLGTNAVMNPETAYAKNAYEPLNDAALYALTVQTYANYAAMTADLAKTEGTVAKVTNGSGFLYFIKQFASGVGYWRPVSSEDGFVRRWTDTIHNAFGWKQMGEQCFAWIKNNM